MEMQERSLPLEGIKVLDPTWWLTGPWITRYLADFGATVVKVESTKRMDLARLSEPYKDRKVDANTSVHFLIANTSKYSFTLNIREPQGKEIFRRLAKWADVVVENFSPGTMKRLGFGYEQLKEIKPDIIMLSATILGQSGASMYVNRQGGGLVSQAVSGFQSLTGWPDREPSIALSHAWADVVTPRLGLTAILAALEYRDRTGKGQYIDICQVDSLLHYCTPAIMEYACNGRLPRLVGNRNPNACPHGIFRCQGDENSWCAIAVFNEAQWQGFCQAIGEPDWINQTEFRTLKDRKENEDLLERLIEEITVKHEPEEIVSRMLKEEVPASVVQTVREVVDLDPQLKERQCWIQMEHPVIGYCNHPAPSIKLTKAPAEMRTAPLLGQHNEYVCKEILGMSDEEFARLVGEGILE